MNSITHSKFKSGFTLLEVLTVVAIVSVLLALVILVINPIEILRATRDSRRFDDLEAINKSLNLIAFNNAGASFGNTNTLYTSLPDEAANCGSYGLPTLPTGWTYACASEDNYKKVDGTGWIPVNFNSFTETAMFGQLPVDTVNSATNDLFYTYATNGTSWELNVNLEAERFRIGGDSDKVTTDGGDSFSLYEVGTNLTISGISDSGVIGYWPFDNNYNDVTSGGHTAVESGGVTFVEGKVGKAVYLDGSNDWIQITGNLGLNGANAMSISLWFNTPVKTANTYFADNRSPGSWWFIKDYTGGSCASVSGDICFDNRVIAQGSDWNINTWHHIVITDSASAPDESRMYIDGQLIDTGDGETITMTTNLRFGTRFTNTGYWEGSLDDVRVYNRVLTPADVLSIYNGTK